MSGQEIGGVAVGVFAILLGAGGTFAALRTRRNRADIATTYGSAGGIVYTGVQIGCSGLLIVGGLVLIVFAVLSAR